MKIWQHGQGLLYQQLFWNQLLLRELHSSHAAQSSKQMETLRFPKFRDLFNTTVVSISDLARRKMFETFEARFDAEYCMVIHGSEIAAEQQKIHNFEEWDKRKQNLFSQTKMRVSESLLVLETGNVLIKLRFLDPERSMGSVHSVFDDSKALYIDRRVTKTKTQGI